MKKHILKSLITSVLVVMSLFAMSVSAYAVSGESYTLTVDFETDNSSISGSQVKVYRVFDRNNALVGDFAKYNVKLGDATDSEALGKLSDTLSAYVTNDNIKADYSGTTGASGKASFTVSQEGIYLITATPVDVGDFRYTPKPSLVRIPYVSASGERVTQVTVELKYERRNIGTGSVSTSATTSETSVSSVSTEISSTTTESVTSSVVTSSAYNNTTTTSKTTVTTSEPTTTTVKTSATTTVTEPELPQTGQLWWPVPVMFIAGVLILLVGIIVCYTTGDEKK